MGPPTRSAGNYRIYEDEDLRRLRFVRAAQEAGFRLADIPRLIELLEGAGGPCEEVRLIIEQSLSVVVDNTAPTVTLISPEDGAIEVWDSVWVHLYISDQSPVLVSSDPVGVSVSLPVEAV